MNVFSFTVIAVRLLAIGLMFIGANTFIDLAHFSIGVTYSEYDVVRTFFTVLATVMPFLLGGILLYLSSPISRWIVRDLVHSESLTDTASKLEVSLLRIAGLIGLMWSVPSLLIGITDYLFMEPIPWKLNEVEFSDPNQGLWLFHSFIECAVFLFVVLRGHALVLWLNKKWEQEYLSE